MTESRHGESPSELSAIESNIWNRVAAFRDSGLVDIKGMAGTDADWLHEFAKQQEWLRYASRIWPDNENPGIMNVEELAVLEAIRLANPSEEDATWATVSTQASHH